MKRRRPPDLSGLATPSVVLRAFAPETEFSLSLDGWILLEALGNKFVTGGSPGFRDVVVAALVMSDEDAVFAARRKGNLDALIAEATKGRRPSHAIAMLPKVRAAFDDSLAPADTGAAAGDEKKSSAAPAGGSP